MKLSRPMAIFEMTKDIDKVYPDVRITDFDSKKAVTVMKREIQLKLVVLCIRRNKYLN